MAISFDSVTRGSDTTGPATNTTSHTVGTGNNRILFGACVGNVIAQVDNITGMTYNGVAMTLIDKSNGSGDRWQYLYYLLNPDSGAHNFVISSSGGSSQILAPTAISYSGVRQELPEARQKTTGTTTSKTETITVLTNNSWVIGMMHAAAAVSAGAGTTERSNNIFYDKNAAVSAGAQTIALTWTGTVGWAYILCAMAPFISGGVSAVYLSDYGVM